MVDQSKIQPGDTVTIANLADATKTVCKEVTFIETVEIIKIWDPFTDVIGLYFKDDPNVYWLEGSMEPNEVPEWRVTNIEPKGT